MNSTCPTSCGPVDCSQPGSSVPWDFQNRHWVDLFMSLRDLSHHRNKPTSHHLLHVSPAVGGFFINGKPLSLYLSIYPLRKSSFRRTRIFICFSFVIDWHVVDIFWWMNGIKKTFKHMLCPFYLLNMDMEQRRESGISVQFWRSCLREILTLEMLPL